MTFQEIFYIFTLLICIYVVLCIKLMLACCFSRKNAKPRRLCVVHFLRSANQAGRCFVRSQYEVSISFAVERPQLKRGRHSISEDLHVLYENSIVYGDICMYYRISIFQKTAISILDSDVGYIACLLPLRSRIVPQ